MNIKIRQDLEKSQISIYIQIIVSAHQCPDFFYTVNKVITHYNETCWVSLQPMCVINWRLDHLYLLFGSPLWRLAGMWQMIESVLKHRPFFTSHSLSNYTRNVAPKLTIPSLKAFSRSPYVCTFPLLGSLLPQYPKTLLACFSSRLIISECISLLQISSSFSWGHCHR